MAGDTEKDACDCFWRTERADALAFVIDGEDYFKAVREAVKSARESVMILAWDFHTKVRMIRGDEDDGYPAELGAFLNAVLESNPELEIRVLVWDFAIIYAAEREWSLTSEWLRDPHPRLHFERDSSLPTGASQHQKVVVVDDTLAFCGGLDLSLWRWDTQEHKADDRRRTDPAGERYGPYHDLAVAVDGPAAGALAELSRRRWKHATGRDLPALSGSHAARWPDRLEVAMRNVEVGIARTWVVDPENAVHEVEALHLKMIRSARRFLYIENQYFSSRRIADALIERLGEAEPPEIVMVLTQNAEGWMEEGTLGLIRDRLLERVSAADAKGRFRVLAPVVAAPGGGTERIYVHAKLLVADDAQVKIGSSNLSNRSMRVDSECDLFVDAGSPDPAIRQFRHHLIGNFLGIGRDDYAAREEQADGSLIDAIGGHDQDDAARLRPFHFDCGSEAQRRLADSQLLDPEEPIDPGYWIRKRLPGGSRKQVLRRGVVLVSLLALAIALGLAAKQGWGPFPEKDEVVALLDRIRGNFWTPAAVVALFVVAASVGVPLNLLLVAATLVLGPWIAFGCGLTGALAGAALSYGLGLWFGRRALRRLFKTRFETISERLGGAGIWPVIFVRVVPVAPFAVINLVAGACRIPFNHYAAGSIAGMLPGIGAVVFLTHQFEAVAADPGWTEAVVALASVCVVAALLGLLVRALRRRSRSGEGA